MAEKLGKLRQLEMIKPTPKEKERLEKKMKSRFDGRWVIVILFTLTLLASLFFYLKTQVPSWLGDFFSPQVIISKPPK